MEENQISFRSMTCWGEFLNCGLRASFEGFPPFPHAVGRPAKAYVFQSAAVFGTSPIGGAAIAPMPVVSSASFLMLIKKIKIHIDPPLAVFHELLLFSESY
jgi:hypothetical protein